LITGIEYGAVTEKDESLPDNLVCTADGSISARDSATGELYHNRAGAYLEALNNYIRPSRWQWLIEEKPGEKRRISLVDGCFGLGYNSFVLWDEIVNRRALLDTVEVEAVEIDPGVLAVLPAVLSQDCFHFMSSGIIVDNLSCAELADDQSVRGRTLLEAFQWLADKQAGVDLGRAKIEIRARFERSTSFTLQLYFADLRAHLQALHLSKIAAFDFVFHDPFSPSKVPELWTIDIFQRYHKLLSARATSRLLTYSAASAVRGGLQGAGFSIYRTMAVGAKTGGTLAVPVAWSDDQEEHELADGVVLPLADEERKKLAGRSGVPYKDPNLCADRRHILKCREAEQHAMRAKLD